MESLPASRKIFLGCVYPGPLLYNNVVYGCPSTSDILLSEPEAKKRRGERGRRRGKGGGHAIDSSITSVLRLLCNVVVQRTILKKGNSGGMIVIFLRKWELPWPRGEENNGISWVFIREKGRSFLTILFTYEWWIKRNFSFTNDERSCVFCLTYVQGIISSNCVISQLRFVKVSPGKKIGKSFFETGGQLFAIRREMVQH